MTKKPPQMWTIEEVNRLRAQCEKGSTFDKTFHQLQMAHAKIKELEAELQAEWERQAGESL